MTTKAVSTLPPIRVSQSCSWCHEYNGSTGLPVWCRCCGHRGDLPRAFCNCDTCESGIVLDDNKYMRQALDELAPGKKFIDLDRDLQSRVVQRAQELKKAASSQLSALSQSEGGAA